MYKVFDFLEGWCVDQYGMLWYKLKWKFGKKEVEYLWVLGFGGNYLLVVLVEKMVIVIILVGYGLWFVYVCLYCIFSKLMNVLD